MAEATHSVRVELTWSLWGELRRFCRFHGYDEAQYIAWLVQRASRRGASGAFPLPSVFDSGRLQHFGEA